jgi:hypothetical protein
LIAFLSFHLFESHFLRLKTRFDGVGASAAKNQRNSQAIEIP